MSCKHHWVSVCSRCLDENSGDHICQCDKKICKHCWEEETELFPKEEQVKSCTPAVLLQEEQKKKRKAKDSTAVPLQEEQKKKRKAKDSREKKKKFQKEEHKDKKLKNDANDIYRKLKPRKNEDYCKRDVGELLSYRLSSDSYGYYVKEILCPGKFLLIERKLTETETRKDPRVLKYCGKRKQQQTSDDSSDERNKSKCKNCRCWWFVEEGTMKIDKSSRQCKMIFLSWGEAITDVYHER